MSGGQKQRRETGPDQAKRDLLPRIRSTFNALLSIGISPAADLDRYRRYRQANGIALVFALVSLAGGISSVLAGARTVPVVQAAFGLFYLSAFLATAKGRLEIARSLLLYGFEAHIFLEFFFTLAPPTGTFLPYSSNGIYFYALYPLLAVLFERSVRLHLALAMLQLVGGYAIVWNLPGKILPPLLDQNTDAIYHIVVMVYCSFMISLIARLLSRELLVSIARLKRSQEEVEFRRQKLEKIAVTDNLTGIFNRTKFDEAVSTVVSSMESNPGPASLILMDVDHFKHVNDTYGHMRGDMVLKEIANLISTCIREGDTLARWGGEEFMLLLPGARESSAKECAERIRNLVGARDFGTEWRVTLSLGIAPFEIGDTADSWVHRADNALYRAKYRGRNRVEIC